MSTILWSGKSNMYRKRGATVWFTISWRIIQGNRFLLLWVLRGVLGTCSMLYLRSSLVPMGRITRSKPDSDGDQGERLWTGLLRCCQNNIGKEIMQVCFLVGVILLALIYIVCAVGAFDIFYYVDLTAVYGHIAFKFVLVKFLILLHQELFAIFKPEVSERFKVLVCWIILSHFSPYFGRSLIVSDYLFGFHIFLLRRMVKL